MSTTRQNSNSTDFITKKIREESTKKKVEARRILTYPLAYKLIHFTLPKGYNSSSYDTKGKAIKFFKATFLTHDLLHVLNIKKIATSGDIAQLDDRREKRECTKKSGATLGKLTHI